MKKRIAKKVLKDSDRYAPHQVRAAEKRIKRRRSNDEISCVLA